MMERDVTTTELSAVSTAALSERCCEETTKFLRGQRSDPRFCFELLRRALAEQSDEAFTQVYRVYEQLVTNWVYRHSQFARTGESAEYFTSAAFRSFYFALNGAAFARFTTLAAVLGYLKTCVHTQIGQYLRTYKPCLCVLTAEVPESTEEPDLGARVQVDDVWSCACRLLSDDSDRLLARCAFVLGLKPRQICVAYPALWQSEREVSVALYRIRRLLRADPELAAMAGRAAPT